jgi:hypothetical protein
MVKKGVLRTINSEVCTPLTTRCLRAPLLYSAGFVNLARPHQPCLWHDRHHVWREQGPRWFGQKLNSEDGGESSGRDTGDPLACGEGPGPSTKLPIQELSPCEGLQRGLQERLHASRYLSKNTRVIDRSLHLYLIFTFHIYIATMVVCFTFLD